MNNAAVYTPFFHLVQVHPEIPQNTGTIGRLCVSSNTKLHLVKPYCFEITDKNLKRAGLDYWPYLQWAEYDDFAAYEALNQPPARFFFSTKTDRSFWDVRIPLGAHLIFGAESKGLPPSFYSRFADELVTLPMPGTFHRSLNVANSASIALYEAIRQNRAAIFGDPA